MAKTGYPCIKNTPSLSCRTCPDRCPDVLTDNLDAWTIWAAVRTQWRTAGMDGAIIGLDYGAMYAVAKSLCIDDLFKCRASLLYPIFVNQWSGTVNDDKLLIGSVNTCVAVLS